MKEMRCQSDSTQLFFGDLDGGVVSVGVQGRLDDQAGLCGGTGKQADNGLMAHQVLYFAKKRISFLVDDFSSHITLA